MQRDYNIESSERVNVGEQRLRSRGGGTVTWDSIQDKPNVATAEQLDGKVSKSGDTMSGILELLDWLDAQNIRSSGSIWSMFPTGGHYGAAWHITHAEKRLYIIPSLADDPHSFSNLRPLFIDLETGLVEMRHGLTITWASNYALTLANSASTYARWRTGSADLAFSTVASGAEKTVMITNYASGKTTFPNEVALSVPLAITSGGTGGNTRQTALNSLTFGGSSGNIDTVFAPGTYLTQPTSPGSFPTSAPATYGILTVEALNYAASGTSGYYKQTYSKITDPSRFWIRQKWDGGSWSAWYKYSGVAD